MASFAAADAVLMIRNYNRGSYDPDSKKGEKTGQHWGTTAYVAVLKGKHFRDFSEPMTESDYELFIRGHKDPEYTSEDIEYFEAEFDLKTINWDKSYIHKVFPSKSEKYLVYQKNLNYESENHETSVLCYCESQFDKKTYKLKLSNEICFTENDPQYKDWYPKFTPDEKFITFGSSREGRWGHFGEQIFAFDLETKATRIVTLSSFVYANYWYPTPEGVNDVESDPQIDFTPEHLVCEVEPEADGCTSGSRSRNLVGLFGILVAAFSALLF